MISTNEKKESLITLVVAQSSIEHVTKGLFDQIFGHACHLLSVAGLNGRLYF